MIDRTLKAILLSCSALLSVAESADAQDRQDSPLVEGRQLFGLPRLATTPSPLAPLTGRIVLNGTIVDYGTSLTVDAGAEGATNKDRLGFTNLTYTIDEDVREEFAGRVYLRKQKGWYFQLSTIDTSREVLVDYTYGGSLTGFKLQFTATGKCVVDAANADKQCTFTPGLKTAGNDPDSLIPNAFGFSKPFGSVVSAETVAALKADGFQRGVTADSDELVGIDFDVLNAGFIRDETSSFNQISQRDRVERAFVPVFSKIDQTISSNDSNAAVSRDVRGVVLLPRDQWTSKNLLAHLLGWTLPSMRLQLPEGVADPRLNLSNNLFNAVNNAWLPQQSYTIYSTGRAILRHSAKPPTRATETPVATYSGFWLGLSPIRTGTVTGGDDRTYTVTGPRESVSGYQFQQGGGDGATDLLNGGVTGFDTLTNSFFDYPFATIDDFYVQLGLDVTTQEAVERTTVKETYVFDYVPHLAFSENRTAGTTVTRWYAGAILTPETKAYFGSDITLNAENGWNGYAKAEYYSVSDADYYSSAEARISRRISLASGDSVTLGVAGNSKLGRELALIPKDQIGDQISKVDLFGVYVHKRTEYSLRQRQNGVFGGARTQSTTLGITYRISDSFALAVQATPISNESSYIEALASMSWQFADGAGAPTLKMQVAKIRYRLTEAAYADPAEINFTLGFGVRF